MRRSFTFLLLALLTIESFFISTECINRAYRVAKQQLKDRKGTPSIYGPLIGDHAYLQVRLEALTRAMLRHADSLTLKATVPLVPPAPPVAPTSSTTSGEPVQASAPLSKKTRGPIELTEKETQDYLHKSQLPDGSMITYPRLQRYTFTDLEQFRVFLLKGYQPPPCAKYMGMLLDKAELLEAPQVYYYLFKMHWQYAVNTPPHTPRRPKDEILPAVQKLLEQALKWYDNQYIGEIYATADALVGDTIWDLQHTWPEVWERLMEIRYLFARGNKYDNMQLKMHNNAVAKFYRLKLDIGTIIKHLD